MEEENIRVKCMFHDGTTGYLPALPALKYWIRGQITINTALPGFVSPIDYEPIVKEIIEGIREKLGTSPSEEARRMLIQQNAELEHRYQEQRASFDHLRKVIYEVMLGAAKRHPDRSLTYMQIIEAVWERDRTIKAETITRRVRELVEEGKLIRVGQGKFALANRAMVP